MPRKKVDLWLSLSMLVLSTIIIGLTVAVRLDTPHVPFALVMAFTVTLFALPMSIVQLVDWRKNNGRT